MAFLTKGQCKVEQQDIDSFLSLVSTLKVEGLTSGVEEVMDCYEEVKVEDANKKARIRQISNKNKT